MFKGYRSIFVFVIVFVQSCCFCVKIAENILGKVLKLNLFLDIIQRMLNFAQNFEVTLAYSVKLI